VRLLNGTFSNFGSHKHLEIDFSNIGLGLIYGRTGSGKSTIPDTAAWTLFGITAKDGSVDEVRSWQSPGEPTTGVLSVELPDGKITVTRVRGKQSQNDLYWTEESTPDKLERGKDIVDTQRKLNQRLGMDSDLYLSGAYFHEFSSSGSFFTAKAKDRRALFERIASLELPIKLGDAASSARKEAKADLQSKTSNHDTACGRLQSLKSTFENSCRSSESWEISQKSLIENLGVRAESFEADKASKIAALTKKAEQFEEEKQKQIEELKMLTGVFDRDKANKLELLKKSSEAFEVDRNAKLDAWGEQLQQQHAQIKDDAEYSAQIGDLKGKLQKLSAEKCKECGGPKAGPGCDAIREQIASREKARYENKTLLQSFDALADKIEALQASTNPFLSQIQALQDKTHSYAEQIAQVVRQENPYPAQISQVASTSNPHLAQMAAETEKQNPFKAQLEKLAADIIEAEEATVAAKASIAALEYRVSALTQLYDLSFELRGELLKKAVRDIETNTNSILERHFDAELRVTFTLDADELEVSIKKSGYDCVYRQLSKGQRQLLKLSFVVSIMRASANRAGVHFANLFFDESLDGLDADLKVKAFNLFGELETQHESILVIDHLPDFQNLFSKKFKVEMVGDCSVLEAENE
jgi:DNA repair exonuclease SbcCD ATPase subunit